MMERNSFLSKSSFAVFVWLAISVSIMLNTGSLDLSNLYKDVKETVIHALDTTKKIVEPLAETVSGISPAFAKTDPIYKHVIPTNDLQCMAENIFYESATQSFAGKIAVGQVVLNRTKAPGYPSTICGVIWEGSQSTHTSVCQFSWTCETRKPIDKTSLYWRQSLAAAKELLNNKDTMLDITEGATNYHADYVKPLWSKQLRFITKIDQHIFYGR
jgi:spore germination cell wall hydrolase CwlJ-like protein